MTDRTERGEPAESVSGLDFMSMSPEQVERNIRILRTMNKEFRDDVNGDFESLAKRHIAQEMLDSFLAGDEELVLVTEEDIRKRPAPEWWLEGLIQKGTITVLAGPGGIGKSFLSLHIARCVALGIPAFMLGTRKGKVLYVIAEGANSFGKRARAWDDYQGTSPAGDSIQYVEKGVNLSSEASVARLCKVIEEGEFDLIILDTWSQLSHVEDENSNGKTAAAMRNVKRLRDVREGSSVLVVHHTDAKGTKARGATAVRDNTDATIMVKSQEKGLFFLSTKPSDGGKLKDGSPLKMEGFELRSHLDSAVVVHTGKKHESPYWIPTRDLLLDGQFHSSSDIRKACGIPDAKGTEYDRWKKFLPWCVEEGLITRGGPTTHPVYKLVAPDQLSN